MIAFILGVLYITSTSAETIPIVAYHKNHEGINKLINRDLFIQIPGESFFYTNTDASGIFNLSDLYATKELRAYLVKLDGTILAGCFSDFVPVKIGQVILKGIDCL